MQLDLFLKWWKTILGDMYDPVTNIFKSIVIITLAILLAKAGRLVIIKIFEKQKKFKYGIDGKRVETMCTLLVSIFRYGVYLVAAVSILTDVFNLKSVLAAAGIGGIAIGLGAQSLIKDIISGFFIIIEDQFAVGDLVTIEGMTGTVEVMELRITKIRNFNGDLHIIPNGEIKKITNHTRGDRAVLVDIPVAYSSDIAKAFDAASRACNTVQQEFGTIVEEPKVLGITDLGKENLTLRIMGKTLPNENWAVERRLRQLVREEFEAAGIRFFDTRIIT